MKNWPLFFGISVSLLLVLKPSEISKACGFDMDDYLQSFSFFDPALTQQEDFSALYLSWDRFYDYRWDSDSLKYRDNLQEWQDYHKGKPSKEDLAEIVYKVPVGPLEEMKAWLEGSKSGAPADSLQQNSVVAFWKKNRWSMPACYLDFAKKCEPHVTGEYDPWAYEEIERDTAAMSSLITEGIEKYSMLRKDPFLQMRYAYQVIRLAHYSDKYQETIDLFEQLVPPIEKKANTQIYYWALAHKAGAMRSLGQEVEAAYLFSQVFDHSPTKRIPAWLSFRVESDEAWSELMSLCQDEAEKSNLFFMRAIEPEAYVLEEMQAIYAVEPKSPKLGLLLSREINKLESDLFGWDFDFEFPLKTEYDGVSVEKALAYRGELESFVRQVNQGNKASHPGLWKLAEGYLAFMDSRFDEAEQIFVSLARSSKDAKEKRAASLFQWVCQVSRLNQLPLATEDRLYKQLSQMDFGKDPHRLHRKAEEYLLNRFRRMFEARGDSGKAFLCRFDIRDLQVRAEQNLTDETLEWAEDAINRGPTSLEKMLLKKLELKPGIDPLVVLRELQATLLLREGRYSDALVVYESLPEGQLKEITYFRIPEDPFEPLITDCFGCFEEEYHEAGPTHYQYDRMSFARKMLALQNEIERNASMTATNSMLLGTAIYNTSDYGVCWMAGAYFRGSYGSSEEDADLQRETMLQARDYFDQVVAETADMELSAQALFMAAKCEQVLFYLDGYSDWESKDLDIKIETYRGYFETLTDNYKNTQYYQEAIRECGYLQTYSYIRE